MKTKTRTPDEIYAEIEKLNAQDRGAAAEPESSAYWRATAGRAEERRDLWRLLGKACGGDAPEWARYAAFRTGDHYADQAERYRTFALQVEREGK